MLVSVQFVIGSASQDHSKELVKMADEWLQQSSDHEVFYLVPNHVKFETEIHVLKELAELPRYSKWGNMVSMRLHVFSFSRLAWYYLQNTAEYQEQQLSTVSKFMILKQVLLENAANLELFQYEINKPGFVEQLIDLFDELQEGFITPEDLEETLNELKIQGKVTENFIKLNDIKAIYTYYSERISELDASGHDLLLSLGDYLQNKNLKNVMFIVSGFSNFTAIEKQLIESLMKASGEFKISLVVDKAYTNQVPEARDLFFNTGHLYYELYQIAKENKLPILFDKKLTDETTSMTALDIVWQQSQKLMKTSDKMVVDKRDVSLEVWNAVDPYNEMLSVAKEIRRLVSIEGYRYQDITVLTRDLASYQQIISPILVENDIPFYFNQEEEMKHHPLIEFINALFQMKQHFYQYKDVLRFLRSEIFSPNSLEIDSLPEWENHRKGLREAVDYTENVVLAYGYSGSDWVKKRDWRYVYYQYEDEVEGEKIDKDVEIQHISNDVRHLIRDYVAPFFEKLDEVKLGKEASLLFYEFMIQVGVEKQIQFMRDLALERGDLVKAKNHEQTWQAFVTLLDEYTELMGELDFDLDDFIQIFKTGLEGLTYSKVPTTLDQLEITSMDFVRAKKSKVTFIIGATDQQLPKKIENKTLLSDEERGFLKEVLPFEKYLKKDQTKDLAREPFVFYLSLLSATDKLIITYPKSSDNSKELKISPYVTILKQELQLKEIPKEQGFKWQEIPDRTLFSTDDVLLREWIDFKRQLTDEKQATPWIFHQLEKRLLKKYPLKTTRLLASLAHENIPENLSPVSVETLYGETVYASVSKIENFHKCQYKYFLMYGLGLRERDQFELSPAATGDFYHEALDQFFKEIIKGQYILSQMTQEEIQVVTENVLKEVLGQDKFGILNTTNRMNYIKYQLSKTIERIGWSLKKQSERSNMTVVQTEVLFGQILQDQGLASLDFDLSNRKKLKVRGKIDRIDKMKVEDDLYLSVIDYKSSKHNFDFVDAYYGLALQMITYLNVALNNAVSLVGEEAKAAGAFYMHVQNPMIPASEKINEENIEEELLKSYQYNGLLTNEEAVLELLDKTMEPGVKSLVYPYQQLKKETMKSSQFVTNDELDFLIENNQNRFKEAGEAIFEGSTLLNPAYRKQKRIACEYCPFRSVCQFDVMLKENNYHRIEELSKEEIMEKDKEVDHDE
ncbi:helicase-exonuclease AddAB, AddB subunit [Enterococcus sp. 6C8_DIV0013]|nr:helicase-exonuclease AddAB, AddB subunit [Enterococcus sp. 6C8_DIV0013]